TIDAFAFLHVAPVELVLDAPEIAQVLVEHLAGTVAVVARDADIMAGLPFASADGVRQRKARHQHQQEREVPAGCSGFRGRGGAVREGRQHTARIRHYQTSVVYGFRCYSLRSPACYERTAQSADGLLNLSSANGNRPGTKANACAQAKKPIGSRSGRLCAPSP